MYEFKEKLELIKEKGLYREMMFLNLAQGTHTMINGMRVLLLSSNSYLGLCDDERLKMAGINAIRKFGVGAGGSRLTTGSYEVHRELEERLAHFKGTESCLIFSSGYSANIGTISGLFDKDWVIFCDRLNHASIIDGCRLSGSKLVVYRHCDMDDLEKKIKRYHKGKGLIVTDGIFSMDGDIAPIPAIIKLSRQYNLMTMVDDAHATGVLGSRGAGTLDYFGIKDKVDIQMGTLSKAFGSEGGYIAGKKNMIDFLRHKAKSFIYSTALAPHTIAISLKALEIIQSEPERRRSLLEKSLWFCQELAKNGFEVPSSNTPIIPLMVGGAHEAAQFSKILMRDGIYVPAIRPPTVPEGKSRLRFSIMATHRDEDLQEAIKKIITVGKTLSLHRGEDSAKT